MRVIVLLCLFLWPGFALAGADDNSHRRRPHPHLHAGPASGAAGRRRDPVPRDITYRVPMTYRAVPVASCSKE